MSQNGGTWDRLGGYVRHHDVYMEHLVGIRDIIAGIYDTISGM